jgi:hypothetical protein
MIPSAAKAAPIRGMYGTAEAVPLQKNFSVGIMYVV